VQPFETVEPAPGSAAQPQAIACEANRTSAIVKNSAIQKHRSRFFIFSYLFKYIY
jgi:hypothetical protein